MNIITIIAGFLTSVLEFFYGLVNNYGVSIILLTILIKLVMVPSSITQVKQQLLMEKIKPLELEIRKKYAENKDKLNQEIVKLYADHGVRPFGSCLFMLIQLPIWFGLFRALSTYQEFVGSNFLWLPDLSKPDPYYIIPVLVGITTYIQFKVSSSKPAEGDKTAQSMAMMNYMFPLLLAYITIKFPSGLGVYWVSFGVLTALEQFLLRRGMKNWVKK